MQIMSDLTCELLTWFETVWITNCWTPLKCIREFVAIKTLKTNHPQIPATRKPDPSVRGGGGVGSLGSQGYYISLWMTLYEHMSHFSLELELINPFMWIYRADFGNINLLLLEWHCSKFECRKHSQNLVHLTTQVWQKLISRNCCLMSGQQERLNWSNVSVNMGIMKSTPQCDLNDVMLLSLYLFKNKNGVPPLPRLPQHCVWWQSAKLGL